VRFDRFQLDEANASLLRDGEPVPLAPTPFAVLCALVRQSGGLLRKDALLDEVWGHKFVSESVLKTVISELRTALDDDARHPRLIETVPRRGYRFIAAVTAAPPVRASVPEAPSLHAPSFIGREKALARLRRAWDAARGGERAVVWVAGEPGIGKTTLIDHFVSGLGDVARARGQCMEQYGAGEPYLPVLEALGELCRSDPAVAPLLRAAAPTWLLQLPWLSTAEEREALRRELAGVGPDRMLREMGALLDRYTEGRPLLLVTEDLHWSDGATLQLIDYVARRRSSGRLMWLASFRLAEVVASGHPLSHLRRELRLHGLCEEIVLDPFSEAEVADYVAQHSPVFARDEAFVRALHERTDGVPLFVVHMMSDVLTGTARGRDEAAAATRVAKIAVPETLAGIIDHYIALLGDEQRLVLSAAAVCGVEFSAGTVAEALARDPACVDESCEKLTREGLWLAAPRARGGHDARETSHSFRHALFRQLLYERTAPAARAQLHRKIGAALERERAAGAPVLGSELAMHFERGGEPMTAMRYYAEAAQAALLHFSPAECITLTEHALTLLGHAPKGVERIALEITLATLQGVSAAHLLGISSSEAKGAFQRAYALLPGAPQHPMRGLLLHGLGFGLCLRAEYAEALALADQVETLVSAANDQVLLLSVCTVQGDVHMLQGQPRAARAWLEQGLAAIASLGGPPEQSFVTDPQGTLLGLLAVQLLHLGLTETARTRLLEARARAGQVGQPMARLVAVWCDALCQVRLGDARRVGELADDLQALVDEFALAQGRAAARWFRGWADARTGQPREGHRRIREAHAESMRLGMLAGGSETLGYAVEALVLAGDWEAAGRELDEALQFAELHHERVYLPQLYLLEASIARARGDAPAAHEALRRAIAEARAQEAAWLELTALVELCAGDVATGEDRRALLALVDRLPEASDTDVVARARGLVGGAKQD
jgi:DNA-binding winged helix-turn-helix (wHTH) protein/tetratricopeptide (TPR) repeat protein